jgi:hypothetical protein
MARTQLDAIKIGGLLDEQVGRLQVAMDDGRGRVVQPVHSQRCSGGGSTREQQGGRRHRGESTQCVSATHGWIGNVASISCTRTRRTRAMRTGVLGHLHALVEAQAHIAVQERLQVCVPPFPSEPRKSRHHSLTHASLRRVVPVSMSSVTILNLPGTVHAPMNKIMFGWWLVLPHTHTHTKTIN